MLKTISKGLFKIYIISDSLAIKFKRSRFLLFVYFQIPFLLLVIITQNRDAFEDFIQSFGKSLVEDFVPISFLGEIWSYSDLLSRSGLVQFGYPMIVSLSLNKVACSRVIPIKVNGGTLAEDQNQNVDYVANHVFCGSGARKRN